MSMRGHKTTIVWMMLLLPCIFFFVKLSFSDEDNSIARDVPLVGSQASIGDIAQYPGAGASNCQCSCDGNTNNNNNQPPQSMGGGNQLNTYSSTGGEETTVLSVGEVPGGGASSSVFVEPSNSGLNETEQSLDGQPPGTNDGSAGGEDDGGGGPPSAVIYVITPTYYRAAQVADLTRLAQTLMLVKNIFWVVAEDSAERNGQVTAVLDRSSIPYVHLLAPRPRTHMDKRSGRGVSNRRKALQWIRENVRSADGQAVIYLADDDNAYDIRLFEEMRDTRKVSVWPVGMMNNLGLSSPIVQKDTGRVLGFHDPFTRRRKFAVDMAGFAVSLDLLLSKPKATMPYKVGYEEDYFLRSLGIGLGDLEVKADNCTTILVWHTKTLDNVFPSYSNLLKEKMAAETNLPALYKGSMKSNEHHSA